jgi:HAD superfamily hydrolase (TIGR01509 family)
MMRRTSVVSPIGRPVSALLRPRAGRHRRLDALAPSRDPSAADLVTLRPDRDQRREQSVNLHTLGEKWWAAFDAAEIALSAAAPILTRVALREPRSRLARERDRTVQLLEAIAREDGLDTSFSHLLSSRSNLRRLLGLGRTITACVINLDGVLIGSASIHLAAWTETFDEFISTRLQRTGGGFAPFNPLTDYPKHIHGKPRLEGVRAFLASRGISLPEGDPDDAPGTETVHGLANRKNTALSRRLDEQGVTAFEGSRRYLETARDAGVHCAVVSASANTQTILERAGLADLIEDRIDGNTMRAGRLRGRPAPDTLLAACQRLGVDPEHTAVFETSPAGVAAARASAFGLVVGVDWAGQAEALRAEGADLVVTGLAELLERSLTAGATRQRVSG